jgi:hypothetical protein
VTTALVGMVAWLPREDWGRLLAALGKDGAQLGPLLEAARSKGDTTLAWTFARAAAARRPAARGPGGRPAAAPMSCPGGSGDAVGGWILA